MTLEEEGAGRSPLFVAIPMVLHFIVNEKH